MPQTHCFVRQTALCEYHIISNTVIPTSLIAVTQRFYITALQADGMWKSKCYPTAVAAVLRHF